MKCTFWSHNWILYTWLDWFIVQANHSIKLSRCKANKSHSVLKVILCNGGSKKLHLKHFVQGFGQNYKKKFFKLLEGDMMIECKVSNFIEYLIFDKISPNWSKFINLFFRLWCPLLGQEQTGSSNTLARPKDTECREGNFHFPSS